MNDNKTLQDAAAGVEGTTLEVGQHLKHGDTKIRVTQHAADRWTIRVNQLEPLGTHHVEDTVKIALDGSYNKALWNQEYGAVFLVRQDNSIGTTITDQGIGLDTECMEDCQCCGALNHEDRRSDNCAWCGESLYTVERLAELDAMTKTRSG